MAELVLTSCVNASCTASKDAGGLRTTAVSCSPSQLRATRRSSFVHSTYLQMSLSPKLCQSHTFAACLALSQSGKPFWRSTLRCCFSPPSPSSGRFSGFTRFSKKCRGESPLMPPSRSPSSGPACASVTYQCPQLDRNLAPGFRCAAWLFRERIGAVHHRYPKAQAVAHGPTAKNRCC